MMRFTAGELAAWSGGVWVGRAPARIAAVTHDSRRVRSGDLYLALRGLRLDGHDFISEAFARGACGVMADAAWTPPAGVGPYLRVADTRQALRALARGYRRRVAPQVVGITGSAGKTSVKEMTACLLRSGFRTAATLGNWNNDIGLPMSLLSMPPDTRYAVIEAGSNHPGEIAVLCGILEPDWGLVTNVGPVHIEHYDSVEAIAREKSSLLASLPPGGMAVVHREDGFAGLLRAATRAEVVEVSLLPGADYVVGVADGESGWGIVRERVSGETLRFRVPGPGAHQLLNASMAVAVARRAGLDWLALAAAFEEYTPPPMRWQRVRAGAILFINDAYNANPVSMRAALCAFAQEAVEGRKWLVLADMLELGRVAQEEHERLGEAAGQGDWAGILTSGAFGETILAGARRVAYAGATTHCGGGVEEIAAALVACVRPGDAVLLKGSRGMRLDAVVQVFEQAMEGRQA